eukprot:sb/3473325/
MPPHPTLRLSMSGESTGYVGRKALAIMAAPAVDPKTPPNTTGTRNNQTTTCSCSIPPQYPRIPLPRSVCTCQDTPYSSSSPLHKYYCTCNYSISQLALAYQYGNPLIRTGKWGKLLGKLLHASANCCTLVLQARILHHHHHHHHATHLYFII